MRIDLCCSTSINYMCWTQEHTKFATFTSSLLKRAEKLQGLIGDLESEAGDQDKERARRHLSDMIHNQFDFSWHQEIRVVRTESWGIKCFIQPRSVTSLETAIATLEQQFEACEVVKVDTASLHSSHDEKLLDMK